MATYYAWLFLSVPREFASRVAQNIKATEEAAIYSDAVHDALDAWGHDDDFLDDKNKYDKFIVGFYDAFRSKEWNDFGSRFILGAVDASLVPHENNSRMIVTAHGPASGAFAYAAGYGQVWPTNFVAAGEWDAIEVEWRNILDRVGRERMAQRIQRYFFGGREDADAIIDAWRDGLRLARERGEALAALTAKMP